jgi:hypothetical protein
MGDQMKFSFDGFGINDMSDPYCPRIATLTQPWRDPEKWQEAGKLMGASPELAAALAGALPWLILLGDFIGNGTKANPEGRCDAILAARDALDQAGFSYSLDSRIINSQRIERRGSQFPGG